MNLLSRLFRKIEINEAASLIAKHGARIRKEAEQRRVHAKARQLRREKGLPPHPVFEG